MEGLTYIDEFLTEDEEQEVLGVVEPLDYRAVTMHGQTARRTVRMFGLDYDYSSRDVVATDPLPPSLSWLRERAADLIDRDADDLAQILVSRYPPGAGIGWHRDAPMFGSKIVGISLRASARMRFQRTVKGEREVEAVDLQPRSAYVLAGPARWSWQHTVPPTKELRYSITFRTLRRERR